MKLTHLALFLTLALLGLTGYLAWDSAMDAKGARNQLELYQRMQKGAEKGLTPPAGVAPTEINVPGQADLASKENDLLNAQLAKPQPLPPSGVAPAPPPPVASVKPHVNMNTSPPPMTPRQSQVVSMPAIAKVKQYDKENGFVVIDAGKNKKLDKGMTFAIRRGPAIIGVLAVGEAEDTEAIGDVSSRTIPPGVTIEVGDDIIQNLPPDA